MIVLFYLFMVTPFIIGYIERMCQSFLSGCWQRLHIGIKCPEMISEYCKCSKSFQKLAETVKKLQMLQSVPRMCLFSFFFFQLWVFDLSLPVIDKLF